MLLLQDMLEVVTRDMMVNESRLVELGILLREKGIWFISDFLWRLIEFNFSIEFLTGN